jgi:hypothetical protein
MEKITASVKRRLKDRPYYAFLYAKNIIKRRLPPNLEEIFAQDAQSAYLYAKFVMKGPLPDFVHNGLLLNSFEKNESKQFLSMYLAEFCGEQG